VLFLPPLHVYAVRVHQYVLLTFPIGAMFVLNYFEIDRARRGRSAYPEFVA